MDMNDTTSMEQHQNSGGITSNGGNCHQYCLKWNNHKVNISGVFDRLRTNQLFCDLTLASADKKMIKCHKILLCAGSGYLEEILTENPSDHPTIVLSQINYEELKHLIDFMYSGEVAVETDKLGKLLEAARILKIKGLWESGLDETDDDNTAEDEDTSSNHTEHSRAVVDGTSRGAPPSANPRSVKTPNDTTATTLGFCNLNPLNHATLPTPLNITPTPAVIGSQKRKRKSNQQPKINADFSKNNFLLEQLHKNISGELNASHHKIPRLPSPSPSTSSSHSSASSPTSSILSPSSINSKSPPNLILPKSPISLSTHNSALGDIAKGVQQQQYGPMFGVSNAYFLTQPPPLNMILDGNSTCGSLRSSKSSDISSTSTEDITNKLAGLTAPLPPKTIDKLLRDIPKLLAQSPLSSSPSTSMQSSIASAITSNAISPLLPGLLLSGNGNSIVPQKNAGDNLIQPLKSQPSSKSGSSKSNGLSKKENASGVTYKTHSTASVSTNQQMLTTGELLANGLQLSVAPVRRYKQYTEETLQQALKEIMEGQSINRSSMKYNIPARTLRDWMKRLNIKSVFTHNHSSSSNDQTNENETSTNSTNAAVSRTTTSTTLNKNTVSVTSVSSVEQSIAIMDIKKLKLAENGGNAALVKKSSGAEERVGSLSIKVEGDDNPEAKTTQVNGLMPSFSNNAALPKILVSSPTSLSSGIVAQQNGLIITEALSHNTTNLNIKKDISNECSSIGNDEEEEEEEEEEEIDDDEEAL